jgi:hypothetical protein
LRGILAYVASGVDIVGMRLRTDQDSLRPVALAGFHHHLGEAFEDFGAGFLLRQRVGRGIPE